AVDVHGAAVGQDCDPQPRAVDGQGPAVAGQRLGRRDQGAALAGRHGLGDPEAGIGGLDHHGLLGAEGRHGEAHGEGEAVAVGRHGAARHRIGLFGSHGTVHQGGGDDGVAAALLGQLHCEGQAHGDADIVANTDLDLSGEAGGPAREREVQRDRHRVVV
ncbi:MAG: hypothetical protein AVDCRST_MAG15-1932, partial [uncultured Rubellimicrobium sp.]